jgi:hypothetical protein
LRPRQKSRSKLAAKVFINLFLLGHHLKPTLEQPTRNPNGKKGKR